MHDYFMLENMPESNRRKFLTKLVGDLGDRIEVRIDRDKSREDATMFRVDFTDRDDYQKIMDRIVSTYN